MSSSLGIGTSAESRFQCSCCLLPHRLRLHLRLHLPPLLCLLHLLHCFHLLLKLFFSIHHHVHLTLHSLLLQFLSYLMTADLIVNLFQVLGQINSSKAITDVHAILSKLLTSLSCSPVFGLLHQPCQRTRHLLSFALPQLPLHLLHLQSLCSPNGSRP